MHCYYYKLFGGGVKAQEFNPCTVNICNVDFRSPVFTTVRKHNGSIPYGNSSISYPDPQYADEGNGKCFHSQSDPEVCQTNSYDLLVYDVYYPDYSNYNNCPLPFIIFVHGGGFSDCVGISADGLIVIAKEFAKRGYVCYLVNYRAGVKLDPTSDVNTTGYTSVQQMKAAYIAAQDVRGAIRSIIKRQNNETSGDNWGDTFRVDLDKMFLGGNSAGAVSVLSAAYYPTVISPYDQSKIDGVFPVASGSPSFRDALGPVDASAYYGEKTIDYYPKIKGILSMWGSMFVPSAYITNPSGYFSGTANTNNAPVISFHGYNDAVFDYIGAQVRFSQAPDVGQFDNNSDPNCLLTSPTPLTLNGSGGVAQYSAGSKGQFDYIFAPLHIFREVYLDCSMKHGLDKCDDHDPTTAYCSDFGIGTDKNSEDVLSYIVQRACTFFQAILGGKSGTLEGNSSIHKVFIECVNNRNKCIDVNLANNDCGANPAIPCNNEAQSANLNCVTGTTPCPSPDFLP